jgi:hypothetical protein
MSIPSAPGLLTPSLNPAKRSHASSSPRVYRLVDERGEPHPILDDYYESHDAAWTEALHWWQTQFHGGHDPIGIGVEVSTSHGDWRTIRYPGS